MGRMAATGTPLAKLASVMRRLPQVLLNVRVADKTMVAEAVEVNFAVERVRTELGETGRVLLRPSGTEQLVRVMVEAPTQDAAHAAATQLAEIVAAVR
jgi:phosphoglucosamine mutase